MRSLLYKALEAYLQGNIEKHVANVKIQAENAVGVAEHPDHIETIDKELGKIAEFEDRLEVLRKYFKTKEVFENNGTTHMTIDANGHITKPLQPAFMARISNPTPMTDLAINTNHTVTFDEEIFDQNADYNNSTYKWTVGETGKYLIVVRAAFEGSAEFFCSLQNLRS